jgi:hypothetical protein
MAMDPNKVIGAGLKDAKIKNSDGDIFDIYGVVTANGDPDRDEIEVKGDDVILGVFAQGLKESITIEANAITFDVLQEITGATLNSSATGADILLGTDSESNPPIVEIQAFTTAKTSDGTATVIKKTWYKVQLTSIKVEQAGENEFKFTAEGTAYPTATDVTGAALAESCISKLQQDSGL